MSFMLPKKAALINEGLSSKDAKVWDDAEKLNRKETLQNVLNQMHTSTVPMDSAICISLDEDSDASFSDFTNSLNDNLTAESRNITAHSHYQMMNLQEINIEGLDAISRDEVKPLANNLNPINLDDNPLTKAHIHSLELQLMHLKNQNQSLQNTIIQDNLNLEEMAVAKSECIEQLNLLKSYFQHLLPPASSNTDPSLSTSSCVLPTLHELRGDVLHETKQILEKSREELTVKKNEIAHIKCESDLQIQQIAAKNISLRNQVQCLQNKIRQQSFINQNHTHVKSNLEQQIHDLKGKHQKLSNDHNNIGVIKEEYSKSVSELKHDNEELRKQKQTLKNQSKQDQSEIKLLLGERNALRGQLDEFLAHSSSKNASESNFHQELLRLQTSYSQSNRYLQDKILSLENIQSEKARILKEAKQNEAATKKKLLEITNACQILIQTLFNLERNNVLFGSENDMSVIKIVNYALMGISENHRKEVIGHQKIQQDWKKFTKYIKTEFTDASIQTNNLEIDLMSCGTNTEQNMSNYYEEYIQLKQKAETITKQNRNLHDSNTLLQNQLKQIATDGTAAEIELNRVKEENITLVKSKKFLQDENRKLVEKRVQIEDIFANSRSEYARLQEKMSKNEKYFKRENGVARKKIEKLEREIKKISEHKDYWESAAKNFEKQLQFANQAYKVSNNDNDDFAATVSFEKSMRASSECDIDSYATDHASRDRNEELINVDASYKNLKLVHKRSGIIIEDKSSTLNALNDQMETLKMVSLTNDSSSTSKLLNSSSYTSTIDNKDIPLEEWLQTWESTMDFHVTEAAKSMSEALSCALLQIIDEVIDMVKEDPDKEKESNEAVENYVETVAIQMAAELQKGLEMIQNYNSNELNRMENKFEDNQRDATKLIAKLESSLQNIDKEHRVIKKQHLLLNSVKNETGPNFDSTSPIPDAYVQTAIQKQNPLFETQEFNKEIEKKDLDSLAQRNEVSNQDLKAINKSMHEDLQSAPPVKDLFPNEKKNTSCAMSDKTTQASSKEIYISDIGNEAENLKEKLKCLLQIIENEQSHVESHVANVKKSSIGIDTKIVPKMLSQGVGTTLSGSKLVTSREQFSQTYFDTTEDIDNTKEQLSKVQANCSQVKKEKETLENALMSEKRQLDSRAQAIRHENDDDLKFLKLYLDSTLSANANHASKDHVGSSNHKSVVVADSPIQERIYRIRQSAERAALISKHEEEQSALITECNAALISKMESFNHHFTSAMEKNKEEVKEDRDKFIRFAVVELKKQYNSRIVNLLQSHQQDIEKVRL